MTRAVSIDWPGLIDVVPFSSGISTDLCTVSLAKWKAPIDQEHHVSPHKHKATGKPYNATSASTKMFIREAVKGKKGPSSIFSDAVNAAGGAVGCESVSDLPRNRQQVKNVRANLSEDSKTDEFLGLFDLCQREIT